jgi:hypothetical protein
MNDKNIKKSTTTVIKIRMEYPLKTMAWLRRVGADRPDGEQHPAEMDAIRNNTFCGRSGFSSAGGTPRGRRPPAGGAPPGQGFSSPWLAPPTLQRAHSHRIGRLQLICRHALL